MSQPTLSNYFKPSKKRPRSSSKDTPNKILALTTKLRDGREVPAKGPNQGPRETLTGPNQGLRETLKGPEDEELKGPEDEESPPLVVPFRHVAPLSPRKRDLRSKEEIRSLVLSKGKIKDLQKALESINGLQQKLKGIREAKGQGALRTPEKFYGRDDVFRSPVKVQDIQRPLKGPQRLADTKPAFIRYHSLSEPEERSEQQRLLPLPYKYKILEELFNAAETTSTIVSTRKETLTYERLRDSCLKLFPKTALTEGHVGQFLTVLPGCYKVRLEKVKVGSKVGLDIVLDRGTLSLMQVADRKRKFRENLQIILLKAHRSFLESLSPPLVIPLEEITRWHPAFKLESVAEVPPADIPRRPSPEVASSAREVLAKASDLLSINHRLNAALVRAAGSQTKPPNDKKSVAKEINKLKGVSASLLQKIRAREYDRSLRQCTITKSETELVNRLRQLPRLVRIIHNTFISEKKAALSLEFLVQQIQHSTDLDGGKMAKEEINRSLLYLTDHLPDFLEKLELTESTYMKMSRSVDLAELTSRLEKAMLKAQ